MTKQTISVTGDVELEVPDQLFDEIWQADNVHFKRKLVKLLRQFRRDALKLIREAE